LASYRDLEEKRKIFPWCRTIRQSPTQIKMLQLSHDALEGKCKDLEEQYKKQARIPKAAKYEIFVYAE
jgi:hypothetical protein